MHACLVPMVSQIRDAHVHALDVCVCVCVCVGEAALVSAGDRSYLTLCRHLCLVERVCAVVGWCLTALPHIRTTETRLFRISNLESSLQSGVSVSPSGLACGAGAQVSNLLDEIVVRGMDHGR